MKSISAIAMLAFGLFFLCGCASTFKREDAINRLGELAPREYSAQEESVERNKPPFKLAVYWDMETIDSSGNFIKKRDWENSEEHFMIPFLNQLKKKNIITDYFFLPRNSIPQNDIDGIFKQAKQDNATAVLCIRSIAFVDWYFNPAGILDLTLLGAVLIPGSNRDALVLLRCDFWDMNQKELDFSIWAEGASRTVGPTFLISSTPAFKKAKERALYNMMKELNSQIHPSFDIKLLK